MTWPENTPSCRFSFLWFPSLTYNTEGSKSKSKQRTNHSLREMEEVTSVAETPADCGIVLNCNEYFPQLNGTPIFVARSIAIIICYKTFGGSKLNFKVESFADLEKRFFVASVLIRTTTLPFWFFRSSVNFFYNDRRWHACITSTHAIVNTCCTPYVLVFSPIHYGFHFHGHQS